MVFTTIEIIALVLAGISVIKILILLVNPKTWLSFVKKIYSQPALLTIVGLIISGGILYLLIKEGIGIVQIFAVMAFMAFFMMMGFAIYSKGMIKLAEGMLKNRNFLKKSWFYILLWLGLIAWVLVEIF